MQRNPFNPFDWYWLSDDGRLFSSAAQALVAESHPAYVAWTAENRPTPWPRDQTGSQTIAALQDVLTPYGLFADLSLYTTIKRDELIDAGFTFGGVVYQSRPTDRENIIGAALMASMAVAGGAQPGNYRWADPDADFEWIALDNTKVKMDAPTVIAFGRAQAARKQALIFAARTIKDQVAAGAITTTAAIDAALAATP
ncbi:hypothetical protein RPPS3_25850 [Rhodopseudomonas palustris]|uniref:DUF4376 domain-containing protein n=1 Tax=Rhodopseudomonas palustris TaxID=1076 RepID=UPI000D1BEC3D|nr:DUF4376 domain-containing protein [Rhodopseudomonas palustris]AVT76648.1 hypothetical protein RPPS3_25850 [Rhodopseudomonas palustris]